MASGRSATGSDQYSWNAELVRACEARICYYVSIRSSREFLWRKAHAAILAVEKEIRRLRTGRIVNMPTLKESTARQELEAIIRGDRPVVPPEMSLAHETQPDRDFDQHPYLRRMEFRGGGYAILMAFYRQSQRLGARDFMFKAEIVREAQGFCDVSMQTAEGWKSASSSGWASMRSLLAHRLVVAGRGAGHQEEFRLTDDGKTFIEAMLRKWPLSHEASNHTQRTTLAALADLPSKTPVESNSIVSVPRLPRGDLVREPRSSRSRTPRKRNQARPTPGTPVKTPPTPFFLTPLGAAFVAASRNITTPKQTPCLLAAQCLDAIVAVPTPSFGSWERVVDVSSDEEETGLGQKSEPLNDTVEELESASADLEDNVNASIENHERFQLVGTCETKHSIQLIVDERERLRDKDPRGLLQRVVDAARGQGCQVLRRRLRLGDFQWVLAFDGLDVGYCSVSPGVIIERKTIADLVGRSATGAHIRQVQRMEICGLPHPFLLIEGNPSASSRCPVYDEDVSVGAGGGETGAARHVVRSPEDIDDLCARLFVHGSPVGVLATRDAEGTARLFGQLTAWMEWSLRGRAFDPIAQSPGERLSGFEAIVGAHEAVREELGELLRCYGVSSAVAALVKERFGSKHAAQAALKACASAESRRLYFEALPAYASDRICAALGFDVTSSVERVEARYSRSVYVLASPSFVRRIGMPLGSVDGVVLRSWDTHNLQLEGGCAAQICVRAEAPGQMARLSESALVIVLPGKVLVGEVLAAYTSLGPASPNVAFAQAAADAIASRLQIFSHANPICVAVNGAAAPHARHRLAIIEGLRTAVLAAARANREGSANSWLLATAELAAVLLDLRAGWRVRVHEWKPLQATEQFVRALVRVASAEAALPRHPVTLAADHAVALASDHGVATDLVRHFHSTPGEQRGRWAELRRRSRHAATTASKRRARNAGETA